MPDESTKETKSTEPLGLTKKQTPVFGSKARVMKPEPPNSKSEVLPLMEDVAAKAVEEGNIDKVGIKRNIERIKKELRDK